MREPTSEAHKMLMARWTYEGLCLPICPEQVVAQLIIHQLFLFSITAV